MYAFFENVLACEKKHNSSSCDNVLGFSVALRQIYGFVKIVDYGVRECLGLDTYLVRFHMLSC